MSDTRPKRRAYAFTPRTQVRIAFCCATSVSFWETVGHAVEPERLSEKSAALVVEAAREVVKACGTPTGSDAALQMLRNRVEGGRLTGADFRAAERLMQLGEDLDAGSEVDGLIASILPIVQHEMRTEALESAISDHGKGAPVDRVIERYEQVASLGKRRRRVGVHLEYTSSDISSTIKRTRNTTDRLPTGITEVDLLLKGGLEKRALGVVLATTGAGKSLTLCQIAVESALAGHDVAYLTLELPEDEVKLRIYSNLVEMSVREMEHDPDMAAARLVQLRERPCGLGNIDVRYDSPMSMTPNELQRWVAHELPQLGRKPKVLLVDYADLMVSKPGTEKRSYEEMRIVYTALRDIGVDLGGWTWTASQAKGGNSGKGRLNIDHAADSINKMRIADLVLAISRTVEDETAGMVRFSVPKRRIDEAHGSVGPLPMQAEYGRVAYVSRSHPW